MTEQYHIEQEDVGLDQKPISGDKNKLYCATIMEHADSGQVIS